VKKTSLYLDPDLDDALARRAADEGLTKAEFIRRTLAAAMQKPQRPKPQAVGIVKTGKPGISEDVDAFLAETGFGED
jgi:Ribbon-helix-helix protein, copG family